MSLSLLLWKIKKYFPSVNSVNSERSVNRIATSISDGILIFQISSKRLRLKLSNKKGLTGKTQRKIRSVRENLSGLLETRIKSDFIQGVPYIYNISTFLCYTCWWLLLATFAFVFYIFYLPIDSCWQHLPLFSMRSTYWLLFTIFAYVSYMFYLLTIHTLVFFISYLLTPVHYIYLRCLHVLPIDSCWLHLPFFYMFYLLMLMHFVFHISYLLTPLVSTWSTCWRYTKAHNLWNFCCRAITINGIW